MEIKCVTRNSPEGFSEDVNKLLKEGWTPQHSTFKITPYGGFFYYAILMTKTTKK